jgi:hypothetical protein
VPHETPGRGRGGSHARVPVEVGKQRTEGLVRANLGAPRDAPPVAGVVGVGGRRTVLVLVHKDNRDHVCGSGRESSYIHEGWKSGGVVAARSVRSEPDGYLRWRVVGHGMAQFDARKVSTLLDRLATLGAGAGSAGTAGTGTAGIETELGLARAWGLCTVWERKGKKTQVYTGGTGITSSAKRTSKTYKVKLTHGGFDGPMEDAEYDGQVQCIVESVVISEVEITGKGTMTYMPSQNVYTDCFENGLRHGEGTLTVQSKGRSLTTNWQQELPAKTGVLTFTGTTCNYEGEVRDFRMQGSGAFASTSPW